MESHEEHEVQPKDDAETSDGSVIIRSSPLTTVSVGLVMLLVGVLAGYFGRPLLAPQSLEPSSTAVAAVATPVAADNANPSASNPSQPSLMDGVIEQTRHFRGEPNAPITIIEFGDFQ